MRVVRRRSGRPQRPGTEIGPGFLTPTLFLTSVLLVLQSPQLAVETLDQALAVLVGLLVGPEVPDLLGAQAIELRGDLINILVVVVRDGERGGLHDLLGVPDAVLDE